MTHIESSKLIDEYCFIPEVVQEILAGNTSRLPLLIDTFESPAFKEWLQTDSALQQVIAKVCADCEKQAKGNNSYALVLQALLYHHGITYPRDYQKTIHLYEQAIQLGNSYAMNNRATMHLSGRSGPVNFSEAIRLYEQAIQLDNSYAMTNRAFMHEQGQGGPIDYLEAIRLYECAVRQGDAFPLQRLTLITFNKNLAKQLLAVFWTDLIKGQSFSTTTLLALSQHCKAEVINRLKEEPLSTSLTFLKQLKTNRNHPLAFILNNGQPVQAQPTEEFKWLMAQAKIVLDTRITFFNQGAKQENNSPFNRLPLEIKVMLFSFVQPNLESDRQENFFCLN